MLYRSILNTFKIDTHIGMLGVCFVKKQIFGILLVLFLFFVIIKGQDLIIVLIFLDSTTLFSVCLFVVQVCVILQPVDGKKTLEGVFFFTEYCL